MYASTHSQHEPGDKAVFPVENDDGLGRLIALFLHNRLFGNESRSGDALLHQLGWADSLVSEMGAMPINDVAKILGGVNACVGVVFDHRKAAAVMSSYRAIKRDKSDLEFFILHGATPTLIRTLFPTVSARVVAATRKALGCESRGGRPPLADAETTNSIYRCWQTLSAQEPNLRRRYMRLHKHFPNFSMATLCAAIETD